MSRLNTLFRLSMLLSAVMLRIASSAQGPQMELATTETIFIVGAHDFDSDGDLDLLNATQMFATSTSSRYEISWIENDGTNTFNRFHGSKHSFGYFGVSIHSIEVHDIDMDGDPDVLAIQAGNNPVLHVFENRDGELYQSQMSVPCTGYVFADLENEGTPSIYITSGLSLHRVEYNDGLFANEIKFTSTSANADRLVMPLCGDFNNDGNNDLALIQDDFLPSNPGQDQVVVVLNTSAQNWTSTVIASGQAGSSWLDVRSITMTDADDDGDLDLYMTFNANGVLLTLNGGNANFGTTCTVPLGVNGNNLRRMVEVGQDNVGPPDMMGISDFNQSSPQSMFYNNITCNLLENVATSYLPFMADINNDGSSDLLQSAFKKTETPFSIQVLNSDGAGNFTSNGEELVVQIPILLIGDEFFPVGDVNQSGWDDIIGTYDGQPTLYELDEDGIVVNEIEIGTSLWQESLFLLAADMNGDGWLDIVNGAGDSGSGGWPRDIYVRWNNGGDLTGDPEMIYNNSNSSMWGMNSGDMDGDGDEDILFYMDNLGVRMLRNLGGGNFSSAITITSDFGVNQMASMNILDIDGDGLLDFSIEGYHYRNLGNTNFSLLFTVPNDGRNCAYADLNGDGYVDLLTSAFPGSSTEVYLNNANTGMNYVQTVSTNSTTRRFSVFDANGDGQLEVLTGYKIFTWNNNALELLFELPSSSYLGEAPDGKKYVSMKTPEGLFFIRDLEASISCLLSEPVVTESYDVLQATPPVGNAQWVSCPSNSPISGANSGTFHVQESGSYALYINNGTCQTTTPCITVNVVPGDLDNDDMVTSLDFLVLLADFGCTYSDCIGDLDGDGIVSVQDLIFFISLFPTQ